MAEKKRKGNLTRFVLLLGTHVQKTAHAVEGGGVE